MKYHILLTFDVEDWFQVENFKECIPFSSWSSYELRVEKNTHRILDLLDSIEIQRSEVRPARLASESVAGGGQRSEVGIVDTKVGIEYPVSRIQHLGSSDSHPVSSIQDPASSSPKATFFILGWIAERLPHLVREIHSRGHEVASHGYCHNLCNECSSEDLKSDLIDSKKLLEDIIGARVYGYRAPSFSIDNHILKIIEKSGYVYDSSFNSFGMHERYGRIDLSSNSKNGIAANVSENFYELPVSNLKLGRWIVPWSGGGYFRFIPFPIFKLGVKSILKKEKAYLFYMHPWEVDPKQPKVDGAPKFYKFRHYTNLKRTESKVLKFVESLKQCHFLTCYEYLNKLNLQSEKFLRLEGAVNQ